MHLCMHELYINSLLWTEMLTGPCLYSKDEFNWPFLINFPKRKLENITVFFLYAVKWWSITSKDCDCRRSSVWSRWALDEHGHTKSACDNTLMYGWNKFVFGVDTERENLKKKKKNDCGTSTACFKACGNKTPLMTRWLITVTGFRD